MAGRKEEKKSWKRKERKTKKKIKREKKWRGKKRKFMYREKRNNKKNGEKIINRWRRGKERWETEVRWFGGGERGRDGEAWRQGEEDEDDHRNLEDTNARTQDLSPLFSGPPPILPSSILPPSSTSLLLSFILFLLARPVWLSSYFWGFPLRDLLEIRVNSKRMVI